MRALHIESLDSQDRDGRHRRSCSLRRMDGAVETGRGELWFEFDRSIEPPARDDGEAYLLCNLMEAMREGRELFLHGTASAQLLSNLTEFRDAWCAWLPALYSPIGIHVDRIAPPTPPGPADRGVFAFSGGVDATFSVWRHHRRLAGHRSRGVAACVLVQGFDIPLGHDEAFEVAAASAERVLDSIGAPIVRLRTNYRDVASVMWEHAFAAALVGALLNLRRAAGACIVGSSEPYPHLVLPWGSNPVTDPLLGSHGFEVLHDGASHSRTMKVKAIAEWPEGAAALRVCWEGDISGRNCGVCEKCMRTKFNFLANGLAPPACFDDPTLDLGRVRLRNQAVRTEWATVLQQARANAVGPAVVRPLEALLAPAPLVVRAWGRLRRELRQGAVRGALGHR